MPYFFKKNEKMRVFCLNFPFYCKNLVMLKGEKIKKYKEHILNCVRFHAPVCFSADIDRTVLFSHGIDLDSPIFVYENAVDNNLFAAFKEAAKEEKFNLLLPIENLSKRMERRFQKLKNVIFYSRSQEMNFLNMINKLNINYRSKSNYNLIYKDKFCKINGVILNPKYRNFHLYDEEKIDSLKVVYREFLLNGNNIYICLKNETAKDERVSLVLNFPLKRGYYLFKKHNGYFSIDNLQNGEKLFFNYISPSASVSYSMIDGLDNSCYATIFLKLNFVLKAGADRVIFFNLSNKKSPLKTKAQFDKLFNLAINKCMDTFDLRVKTKNQKFDQYFNNTLPRKVWMKWLNFEDDDELVRKYMTYRSLFIKGKEKISFVPFKEIGLKELGIFNGEYYKKILISFGAEKCLQVGETKFFNINNITRFSLKKNDVINLSFDRI